MIIAIDNGSLNNNWYETANKLDINILHNNSVLHRFEMGAYKLALEHYRADKYIFIQGTMFINCELDLETLNRVDPIAIAFAILENNLSWNDAGLNFINNLLRSSNMKDWNNDPIVLWNSFCANDGFVTSMINDGLFDLPSNTKAHSCAFERILGCYFKSKLGSINNIVSISHLSPFRKIFLGQDPIMI
jgi:hypothetical protein